MDAICISKYKDMKKGLCWSPRYGYSTQHMLRIILPRCQMPNICWYSCQLKKEMAPAF